MKTTLKLRAFAKWNILAVAIIMVSGWQIKAQTNIAPIISTNWIAAVPSFRDVNGKLYNTERSALWQSFNGKCLNVSTNQILIETYTVEPIEEATTASIPERNYLGQITGHRTVPRTIQVGTKEVPGIKRVVCNYPLNLNPAVGQKLSFRAMQNGTIKHAGDTLELWDCGKPHAVMVVSTNYPHAFKTDGK
jgi:hypothetical protein